MTAPPRARLAGYDSLRVLACIAVVVLHTSAPYAASEALFEDAPAAWWTGNLFDSAARWAVPAFVMLTGALLRRDGDPRPIRQFYRDKLVPIVGITVAWSAFYIAVQAALGGPVPPGAVLANLRRGMPYYHLWYLYMTALLYLAAPLLDRLLARMTGAAIVAAAAVVIGAKFALDVLGFEDWTFLTLAVPFTAYYALGRLIQRSDPRVPGALLATIVVLSLAGVAGLTWRLYADLGDGACDVSYDAFDPLVAAMTVAIVLAFRRMKRDIVPPGAARLTLGVYLVHPFWLLVFDRAGLLLTGADALRAILVNTLAIAAVSFSSVAAARRVPGLRRLV